jgi:hypothetical protein
VGVKGPVVVLPLLTNDIGVNGVMRDEFRLTNAKPSATPVAPGTPTCVA